MKFLIDYHIAIIVDEPLRNETAEEHARHMEDAIREKLDRSIEGAIETAKKRGTITWVVKPQGHSQ